MIAGLTGSLLRRITLRHWRQHWLKTLALMAIVALGVSAFLAIGLANRAAVQSFASFSDAIAGQSRLTVSAGGGHLGWTDARQVREALLDTEAVLMPLLETPALAEGEDGGRYYTLMGIDLYAASNALLRIDGERTFFDLETRGEEPLSFERTFFSSREEAARMGWEQGSEQSFVVGQQVVKLRWGGPLPAAERSETQVSRLLVIDIEELHGLLGVSGQVDRIEIAFLEDEAREAKTEALLETLQQANPGHWILESRAERRQTGELMTQAFRSNLRALAILSLLVALILVFQALDGAVARRRKEIAALRSLGVPIACIRGIWLCEAGMIGALGGAGGIALGIWMARFTTEMVTGTVTTLYYFAEGGELALSWSEIGLAWATSIGICVIAGLWPAQQAARSPTAETLGRAAKSATFHPRRYWIAAAILAVASALAYAAPPIEAAHGHKFPLGGYLLALTLMGLLAVLACLALPPLARLGRWIGQLWVEAKIGLSQFARPMSRHRLALAGVIVSLGMTVAMLTLIGSFERTVNSWISSVLRADVYVSARASSSSYGGNLIAPETYEPLLADPRVADGGTVMSMPIRIDGLVTRVVGYDVGYLERVPHMNWIERPDDLMALRSERLALVSESFARRFEQGVSDRVSWTTAGGEAEFEIVGVYADYGYEQGTVGIDQRWFEELAGSAKASGLALHTKSPSDAVELQREIEEKHPALEAQLNRQLREQVLETFNRTFAVTYALEVIGLTVALAGLGSMLFSLLLERRGEVGALRLIGLRRGELSGAAAWEGVGLAAVGAGIGAALGLLLGLVLIFVINKQSFGWTLSVLIPWMQIGLLLLAVLLLAGAISWSVGYWVSGLRIEHEE